MTGDTKNGMLDRGSKQERARSAMRLTRDERFDDALELFEDAIPGLLRGDIGEKRTAAAAMSYYGLCLAIVRHRYREAVDYCKVSLKHSLVDPEHRLNLALVYLERGDRRRAVQALNAGLRLEPRHRGILRVYEGIGRRGRPVLPFLDRANPLNVWLGRLMRTNSRGES